MINLAFFSSGLLTMAVQTLLMRETLALFAGNELSIGIILALWLAGSALGAFAASRWRVADRHAPRDVLAASFVLAGIYLVLSFLFIRAFRPLLHVFPGEGISLGEIFLGAAIIFPPLGSLAGAQFTFGARYGRPGNVYIFESLGYLAGGILFTFAISPRVGQGPAVLAAFLLNLLCAGALLRSRILLVLPLLAGTFIPQAGPYFDRVTLSLACGGREIRDYVSSPYGQHVAATANGELTLYTDGVPAVTFPDTGIAEAEEFAYLPLLFSPRPRNVLLIGGAGKYLPALLEQKIDRLTVLEQDGRFRDFLAKNAPPSFGELLRDRRLNLVSGDGRRFLSRSAQRYDVILIGLPYPATLSLNRYFTGEFFSLARRRLAPGGIFAFGVPGSSVYLDAPHLSLNRIVAATLRQVFPAVRFVPGDTTLCIASDRQLAPAGALKRRYAERASCARFVSPQFIEYALSEEREQNFTDALDKRGGALPGYNRDFSPKGMLASLLVWQSIFARTGAVVYRELVALSPLLWALLVGYLVIGRNGAKGTAFSSGAAGMGLQMLSVWGLEVATGNVYLWIGLLTACFMGGLSLGGLASVTYVPRSKLVYALRAVEVALFAWALLFLLPVAVPLPAGIYFLLSAGTGLLLGFQFPFLVEFAGTSRAATVYAADLAGGVFAALVFGTLCIPAWGFAQTILFIVLLKAISAAWWLRRTA